ncbi:MAG: hypothetical protein KGD61_07260 [Candidatus Lokiarchaeota archaeon]|nr:hypothetical protein [Candidatus Lokiarchaeota archaeon]
MVKISKFGEDFLLLALRIGKHIKGYVDFYFGPEKLRQIVDIESLTSPKKLLKDSIALIQQLGAQGYGKERQTYLEKMIIAMKTSIELLIGIKISIKDQFLKLYDVLLAPVNESELENLKEEFSAAYGEPESLEAYMKELRIVRKIPKSSVFAFFKKALDITKSKSKEIFGDFLPEKENIIIDIVKNNGNDDKLKWACYEWYLGNYTSRIEVNPNFQMYWTTILFSASHEGYPGHHTEFVMKEKKLYRDLNQFEHSLLILHTPKLVISEGIANTAISVLYSDKEIAEIGLQEFCSSASEEPSLEKLVLQEIVKRKLPQFWYNFAFHALIDRYDDKELIRYAKYYEIFSEDDIKSEIKRLINPTHSKNAFLYNLGSNAIKNKYGESPSAKKFKDLLINPVLPSDLN